VEEARDNAVFDGAGKIDNGDNNGRGGGDAVFGFFWEFGCPALNGNKPFGLGDATVFTFIELDLASLLKLKENGCFFTAARGTAGVAFSGFPLKTDIKVSVTGSLSSILS